MLWVICSVRGCGVGESGGRRNRKMRGSSRFRERGVKGRNQSRQKQNREKEREKRARRNRSRRRMRE